MIDAAEDKKLREQTEQAKEVTESRSNSVTDMCNLVYKTNDSEDAKKVYREAKKTLLEIFG